MSDNRIIFRFKQVNGLTEKELAGVKPGENFVDSTSQQMYYKDEDGNIHSISGTAGMIPDVVEYVEGNPVGNYKLTFTNKDPNKLLADLPLRFVTRFISPASSKGKETIEFNGQVYDFMNNSGQPLEAETLKKGQLIDIVYDGKGFRILNSVNAIQTDEDGNIIINGNPIINGSPVINGEMKYNTIKVGKNDEFVIDDKGNVIIHNGGVVFTKPDGTPREETTQIGGDLYVDGKVVSKNGYDGIRQEDLPDLRWNHELPIKVPNEFMPDINGDLENSQNIVNAQWVRNLIRKGNGLPVGTVVLFDRKPLPVGFLALDGSTFDKLMFKELFEYLGTNILPNYTDLSPRGAGRSIAGGEIQNGSLGAIDDEVIITTPNGQIARIETADTVYAPFLIPVDPSEQEGVTDVKGANIKIASEGSTSSSSFGAFYAIKAGDSIINDANIDVERILGLLENMYNKQDIDKMVTEINKRIDDVAGNLGYERRLDALERITRSALQIGDIVFKPFDKTQVAEGWVLANGDRYDITSPIGKQIVEKLTGSYKTNMKITVEQNTVNVPNMFYTDGRGMFVRAGLTPGVVQNDAIRNITGEVVFRSRYMYNSGDATIFYDTRRPGETSVMHLGGYDEGLKSGTLALERDVENNIAAGSLLKIDASRQVPTGKENVPVNITLAPYIFIGYPES